jgi:hypothetical protein
MSAWIGKSTAAVVARTMIVRLPRWVRQAATQTPATMSPTTIDTQRWRISGVATSVSGGRADPPMSGQSGKTRSVSRAVTFDPKRSRA